MPEILDADFLPAAFETRRHQALVQADPFAREVHLALARPDGTVFRHCERLVSPSHPQLTHSARHLERVIKFLLWQKGASRILIAGATDLVPSLAHTYSPMGLRTFDHDFMGLQVHGEHLTVAAVSTPDELPAPCANFAPLGRHLEGCRIGFDLGGSDRKVAAVIDGRVVFSEEIPWSPYFERDPTYHLEGVHDCLRRAAAHLPQVDAIGGSAAGVYVANEVRGGSLFRGVAPADFDRHLRGMFFTLRDRWGGVPFEVANDGEVTALAASMSLGVNGVLGLSLGTSLAGGYVTPEGNITPWLNELAFAPVDYRRDAPTDEWSGDLGCGVQYFSQQGVARLARLSGLDFATDLPLPEILIGVQTALAAGDPRAVSVYRTVGHCLGHAVAHYDDFYDFAHVLILGRVTTGAGGDLILAEARTVLATQYPEIHQRISFHTPDEAGKRHGQAIAAASLPALSTSP